MTGLITRRSVVRIHPPQPTPYSPDTNASISFNETSWARTNFRCCDSAAATPFGQWTAHPHPS